jgi:hypothetical protein
VSKEKNLLVTGTPGKLSVWNLDKLTCVDTIEDRYEREGEIEIRDRREGE